MQGDEAVRGRVLRRLGAPLHRTRTLHFFNPFRLASGTLSGQVLLCGEQTAFTGMLRERSTAFPFTQTSLWFFLAILISQSK